MVFIFVQIGDFFYSELSFIAMRKLLLNRCVYCKFCICLIVLLCACSVPNRALSQERMTIQDSVIDKPDAFGFGINAAIGDATLLQIIPLLTFTYRHTFSRMWAAEILYAYTGEATISTVFTVGQFAYTSMEVSKTTQVGIIGYYLADNNWVLGMGVSMRHRMYAEFIARYPFLQDTNIRYLLEYNMGVSATVEYPIAQFDSILLSLRAQCSYYFPAFAGNAIIDDYSFKNFPANPNVKWPVPPTYTTQYSVTQFFRYSVTAEPFIASLGAFLRINF
jgi:hypothetical protein